MPRGGCWDLWRIQHHPWRHGVFKHSVWSPGPLGGRGLSAWQGPSLDPGVLTAQPFHLAPLRGALGGLRTQGNFGTVNPLVPKEPGPVGYHRARGNFFLGGIGFQRRGQGRIRNAWGPAGACQVPIWGGHPFSALGNWARSLGPRLVGPGTRVPGAILFPGSKLGGIGRVNQANVVRPRPQKKGKRRVAPVF